LYAHGKNKQLFQKGERARKREREREIEAGGTCSKPNYYPKPYLQMGISIYTHEL
jgi:hypothetical protein